jgi:hypothetical protein
MLKKVLAILLLAIVVAVPGFLIGIGNTQNVEAQISVYGIGPGASTVLEVPNRIQAMRCLNNTPRSNLLGLYLVIPGTPADGPTGKVRMGIYADNRGKPGALMLDAGTVPCQVDEYIGGKAVAWGLNFTLPQGKAYWLVFNLEHSNNVAFVPGQASQSHVWGAYPFGPLPAVFPRIAYTNNAQYIIQAMTCD